MEHGKRHHGNESKQKMVKELRGEEEKSRASRDKLHDICKRLKVNNNDNYCVLCVVVYDFLILFAN